eukprot:GDKH01015786.1.p1 GENE.GDKH01015786.1~~GDKH01015786.1.p1  ORF type:complete len:187 (+),score=47.96 GDKH01015786.1:113-673(+)
MKQLFNVETITIPEGVTVKVSARKVTVTGKFGTLERSFAKTSNADIVVKGNTVEVSMWFALTQQLATLRSVVGHIKNMIAGVTKKFQYKMRLVYVHFPIKINIVDNGSTVEIRHFLGEKRTRVIRLPGDTKCTTGAKDEFVFTGTNVEDVSRSCALVRQSCPVRNKDHRKFLDGIYVSESGILEDN